MKKQMRKEWYFYKIEKCVEYERIWHTVFQFFEECEKGYERD